MDEQLGTRARRGAPAQTAAKGLGWMSLALGVPALAAPRATGRLIGLGDGRVPAAANRAAGVRELVNGAGILTRPDPTMWMWSRVAGDVLDLALMAGALGTRRVARGRLLAAMVTVAALAAADTAVARRLSAPGASVDRSGVRTLRSAVTIALPRDEVYRAWRDFERLPTAMTHLQRVEADGRRSRWLASAPAGRTVVWDAEIVEERAGHTIAWRTVNGRLAHNNGRVTFSDAPGGRGTELAAEIEYRPPLGSLGRAVALAFGEEPEQQVRDDLRRFKQLMETGRIARSEGSPSGVKARGQLLQHAAQPLAA